MRAKRSFGSKTAESSSKALPPNAPVEYIVVGSGPGQSREQIAEGVRNEAWGHHASCTNKIGPEPIRWPSSTATSVFTAPAICARRRFGFPKDPWLLRPPADPYDQRQSNRRHISHSTKMSG